MPIAKELFTQRESLCSGSISRTTNDDCVDMQQPKICCETRISSSNKQLEDLNANNYNCEKKDGSNKYCQSSEVSVIFKLFADHRNDQVFVSYLMIQGAEKMAKVFCTETWRTHYHFRGPSSEDLGSPSSRRRRCRRAGNRHCLRAVLS